MLQAGQSRTQTLVGVRFSRPIQTDPRAQSASCKMYPVASFQGLKWSVCGIDHLPLS